jgi:hypothetical protein
MRGATLPMWALVLIGRDDGMTGSWFPCAAAQALALSTCWPGLHVAMRLVMWSASAVPTEPSLPLEQGCMSAG